MLSSMRRTVVPGKLMFGLLVLLAGTVDASVLRLRAERIAAGPLQVEALQLDLHWPAAATQGRLRLDAGALRAPELGYAFDRLHWECPLQRDADGWRCDGPVRAAGLPAARLSLRLGNGDPQLGLQHAGATLRLSRDADGRWPIAAEHLPAGWLLPLLDRAWPALTALDGPLDGELRFDPADDGWRIAGTLGSTAFGLDSDDGRVATAGLGFAARLDVRRRADTFAIDTTATLRGGELLLGPLYSALPSSPVGLELRVTQSDAAPWRIERLHWSDPAALVATASATVDPAAESLLQSLSFDARVPDLALAHARYLEALLGSLGGGGIAPRGALALRIEHPQRGRWSIDATLQQLGIDDARGRFALADAEGRLRWTTESAVQSSDLRWSAASLHGIAIGDAHLALASNDGWLRSSAPIRLAALGGQVELPRFGWRPPLGERSLELDLGLSLRRLDLARLAERFGWPPFTGELSGDMPAARYEDGLLSFDGGLQVAVFDGRVDVQALRLERPFGVAPRLEADIAIERVDLQPMTAAFGFGEITGRLDGRIAGLRMIDWSPVAFDAALQSSPRGGERRRISARAVDDLTRIGGGGIVGGLQKQMLKMFDTFAYSRIGLACTLRNEVCRMGGLEPHNGGYLIVDGAGLPRITVIGHQRQVDWPVLIARLRAATAAGAVRLQ